MHLSRNISRLLVNSTRYGWQVLRAACLSVCPFVSLLACLKNHTSKCHQIFGSRNTAGRVSVLLRRLCNTLCTSGCSDDVMFPLNGANGPESKTTRMLRPVRYSGETAGTGCEVCRVRLHLVLLYRYSVWHRRSERDGGGTGDKLLAPPR